MNRQCLVYANSVPSYQCVISDQADNQQQYIIRPFHTAVKVWSVPKFKFYLSNRGCPEVFQDLFLPVKLTSRSWWVIIIIIILITNSYIAHFTLNRINALYISALVIGSITSLLSFSAPIREYTAQSCRGAPKAFHSQYQPLPSQVPIYPWVKRSNYSKVSCSRTQVSRPGFEPTLWWLSTRTWIWCS